MVPTSTKNFIVRYLRRLESKFVPGHRLPKRHLAKSTSLSEGEKGNIVRPMTNVQVEMQTKSPIVHIGQFSSQNYCRMQNRKGILRPILSIQKSMPVQPNTHSALSIHYLQEIMVESGGREIQTLIGQPSI